MRLSDFRAVEALAHAREHLIHQRDHAPIEVVIGGFHQAADFIEHVRPAVQLELRYRIQDLEERLQLLGVTID